MTLPFNEGDTIELEIVTYSGYVLENWNEGQWFDDIWQYTVSGNATITANLITV